MALGLVGNPGLGRRQRLRRLLAQTQHIQPLAGTPKLLQRIFHEVGKLQGMNLSYLKEYLANAIY